MSIRSIKPTSAPQSIRLPPKLEARAEAALTRTIDRNHDGTVSKGEVEKFAKTGPALSALRLGRELIRGGPAAKLSADAKAAIEGSMTRVVDRNHDGFLSSEEVNKATGSPQKLMQQVAADLKKNTPSS